MFLFLIIRIVVLWTSNYLIRLSIYIGLVGIHRYELKFTLFWIYAEIENVENVEKSDRFAWQKIWKFREILSKMENQWKILIF